MIRTFLLLLVCTIQLNSFAQNKETDAKAASIGEANSTSVDALAQYIKQNFTSDDDRVRAIYVWITNHINYDVARMLAGKGNPNTPPQTVADVLSTRKAVCQGYADLFIALCKGVGINAIAIPGYTKKDGVIAPLSHAWVAVPMGGQWFLFDPTWGAGYVNDEKFTRRVNDRYYKMLPANFIVDHISFDPMYQFLSNPLNHREFINGKPAAAKVLFSYNDTLQQYNQLSSIEQNRAELRRLEKAGIENDLLRQREDYLKNKLQSFASKNSFDDGNNIYKGVIERYRTYIAHKNKQFSTIPDNDLRQMVDSMVQNVKLSRSLISQAVPKTDAQNQAKTNTLANLDRFWDQLDTEKQFVKKYLSTDITGRKQLFIRR